MKNYLFISGCCLLFAACKKDDNNNNVPKKDLLASAPWVYESGGIDNNRDGNIDFTFEFVGTPPACVLDNKASFNADGSGINDEGNTKCNAALPQTTPFSWAFASNETQLSITGSSFAGISGTVNIRTLTNARLSIARDTSIMGTAATILVNLKH